MPCRSKKRCHAFTKDAVPDPLVDSGNPSHRHQARATAYPTRPCHRMVTLATRSPGRSTPCSSQKKNATVMLGRVDKPIDAENRELIQGCSLRRAALIRGLMTDDEWAYFEPFLIHRGGGRPPRNHRRVLDAVFWLMRTGAPWRDLPEGFGNWNSIFRQFRRWADSGVWDVILEGLAGSGVSDAALQMIDATIIRAHHCAAGGKGGPSATRSVVRVAASQPKSTPAPMPRVCRSAL